MEIDKPIKIERKPKPGKCLYCEIESPDPAAHVEVEHGVLLGDLAAYYIFALPSCRYDVTRRMNRESQIIALACFQVKYWQVH